MIDLPATVTVDFQPYGRVVLGDLQPGEYNGAMTITGRVISGTETSRLFQYSTTRNIAGETRTVYGVKPGELARGHIVRVACG